MLVFPGARRAVPVIYQHSQGSGHRRLIIAGYYYYYEWHCPNIVVNIVDGISHGIEHTAEDLKAKLSQH